MLTEEQKKYIESGGIISSSDPELQKEYTEFVKSKSANITSDLLTPQPEISFKNPNVGYYYPVSSLDTSVSQLQPTIQETQTDDLTKRLQKLNEQLSGQSTLRTQKEQELEIPELQKTQTDLSSQLKALQAEALAIPISIQQEYFGRGATIAGVQPIQTARLRENAIRALTISSLLEASKGNLALAQDQVDRAVAQKYDPIKEEISIKQANLELILKSPLTTLAEKNRAQQQKDIQESLNRSIAQQESNEKEIKQIAVDAVSKGADVVTLQRIQNAKSPEEALRIQTESGFAIKPEKEKLLSVTEAMTLGVPYGTTEAEVAQLGIIPEKAPPLPKPSTQAEQIVAGYAVRLEQAETTLKDIEDDISKMGTANFWIQKKLPTRFQSAEFQKYDQASRNFINAVLRRESGAAIAESEFESARKQYLPQPGDATETLQLKESNRKLIFENLKRASGTAYSSVNELLGMPALDVYSQYRSQIPAGEILIMRDNQIGTIPENEFNPDTDKRL